MRKTWLSGLLMLSVCGCSSMSNSEKGLLGGAAVGTGAGALIGRGNPAAMLVGGAVGAMVGGVAGSDQDRREDRKAIQTAIANDRARNQMGINDIVQLAQRGTPDDIIIRQIDATGSVFNLTADDLNYLQDQNVSRNVISAMQVRRTRTVVVQPRPDVIYVAPSPVYMEPGVSVGIRGRF